jgi:hypothetical protein
VSAARAGAPGLGAYQTAKWAVEGYSAFRTDWGGSSMQVRGFGPDYDQTVGALALQK